MSLAAFNSHITAPAPGFRCIRSGDRSKAVSFTARVENRLSGPADEKSLAKLDALLGKSGTQIRKFYAQFDGANLYRDAQSDAAGIEFFKVRAWERMSREMRESFEAMGFEADEMPSWFTVGIVFGEIPHSANYFLIGTERPFAGQVFYVDHDDFQEEPLTKNFDSLIKLIVTDPPKFLMDRGCYTRYSDGNTDAQWIPSQFLPDVSSMS
jgi:hypothetical protein